MFKYILIVLLVLFLPFMAHSVQFKTTIGPEKELYINEKPVSGDWQFKFKVYRGTVTDGDISEGPVISYVTDIIEGELEFPYENQTLKQSIDKKIPFKLRYVCYKDANPNKIFKNCRVENMKTVKTASGKTKYKYIFKAQSLEY